MCNVIWTIAPVNAEPYTNTCSYKYSVQLMICLPVFEPFIITNCLLVRRLENVLEIEIDNTWVEHVITICR